MGQVENLLWIVRFPPMSSPIKSTCKVYLHSLSNWPLVVFLTIIVPTKVSCLTISQLTESHSSSLSNYSSVFWKLSETHKWPDLRVLDLGQIKTLTNVSWTILIFVFIFRKLSAPSLSKMNTPIFLIWSHSLHLRHTRRKAREMKTCPKVWLTHVLRQRRRT